MKQLNINPEMDTLARNNGMGHWSCVSPLDDGLWVRSDGCYFAIGTFCDSKRNYSTIWFDGLIPIEALKQIDIFHPLGEDWQKKKIASFKSLSFGVRFKYTDGKESYVKIGSNSIAQWDDNIIDKPWIGQLIFSFTEDNNLDVDVEVLD